MDIFFNVYMTSLNSGAIEVYDIQKSLLIHRVTEIARNAAATDVAKFGTSFPTEFIHEGRCLLSGGVGSIKSWRLDTKDLLFSLSLGICLPLFLRRRVAHLIRAVFSGPASPFTRGETPTCALLNPYLIIE
jgi:hypothetical protein